MPDPAPGHTEIRIDHDAERTEVRHTFEQPLPAGPCDCPCCPTGPTGYTMTITPMEQCPDRA